MYTPNAVEVATLWPNLRSDDPWRRFYLEARHLVSLAGERFSYDFHKSRWLITDDAGVAHAIDATPSPPMCACAIFLDDARNMTQPRGPQGITRYCPGTLAYVGYRRILANRFHDLGTHRPRNVQYIFWQGLTQPARAVDVFKFSTWLTISQATATQEHALWLSQAPLPPS